eukprot:TRINITY_DN34912_c0_g1_i1.p1 TRINITY_DN34912_c0_g1~~TRINITY_DN34912_c0_g1_i1.p1  ORF type:complete len:361 (+),score=107.68 TRINITY_DN34912_c0_g1_i1:70-1152(+)
MCIRDSTNGQCFNWEPVAEHQEQDTDQWLGVLGNRVVSMRQDHATTYYRCVAGGEEGLAQELRDYLQLGVPLTPLYDQWAEVDDRMRTVCARIPGVRVLRQEPFECLISFICSSNNNIPRIKLMLTRLRTSYGSELATVPGCLSDGSELTLRAFPSIQQLSAATEQQLRDLGLGYRAKFIVATVAKIQELGGDAWLRGLRTQPYCEVQAGLMQLQGVGRKVADCVAVFSLDQAGSIPVDTHVWQIAVRDYDPTLQQTSSLTDTVYKRVGETFRSRYGQYAGWAHSLLFCAELPSFIKMLPAQMQQDMASFKAAAKVAKSAEKEAKSAAKAAKQARSEQEQSTPTKARKKLPLSSPGAKTN